MENEKIKIVGITNKTFNYADVKETVVKIQGLYYQRTSPELVRLKDSRGKLRFFRQNSPLLAKDDTGTYILKELSVLTEDGIWLDKQSPNVVQLNGKYYRKTYCVQIAGNWYLRTDPLLVTDFLNNNHSILRSESVTLSPSMYGANVFTHKSNTKVIEYKGEFYSRNDCLTYFSLIENKSITIPSKLCGKRAMDKLVIDFQDKTNPQEDRLVNGNVFVDEMSTETVSTIDLLPPSGNYVIRIPKSLEGYFKNAIETYIAPRYMSKLDPIREAINKNFDDMDENENKAKVFKLISRPFPGKQDLYRPNDYPKAKKGKTFVFTGGLKYSFGVEFETSQGLLPNNICEELGVLAVGDRSIGAGEYVTAPLMGDAGINHLEAICEALNKSTLVDNRCGIHVHVGSLFSETARKPTPSVKEAPTFNKDFILNSVKLGALIEEELYSSLPPNRKPTLYHCHSIRRFGDISESNFDEYLGAYIFGPKELWFTEDKTPIKPFDFAPYKLGKIYNSNQHVGQWAEGRYKWLNLIHSYTKSSHRTIEFRVYSATTVFEKVYAYVLTSLAFTYVADNVPKIIKEGITLSQMFEAAFSDYPDILSFLNTFYDMRKSKFKRKDLYPKNHPYLKFK